MNSESIEMWQDSLDQALPPASTAAALAAMRRAARQRRRRRRALAAGLAGAALLAVLIQPLRPPTHPAAATPVAATPPPAPSAPWPAMPCPAARPAIETREIDDATLARRLATAGFTLAIAGSGPSRRYLLVDGRGKVSEFGPR
jgi:hypothetical protein